MDNAITKYEDEVETSRCVKVTILWNQQLQTDRTNPNNTQDIIIDDNERGTILLKEFAVSVDRNVIRKVAEMIIKCKDLITEIWNMWNAKAKVIPETVGPNGTISKSLRQNLSYISAMREIRELQKQPHWTPHTFLNVLM
jgi:hypothetical protein